MPSSTGSSRLCRASVGARITEMPVRHHARRYGESKYGISRTVKVLVDLLTLKMITTFRSRPLVGFGTAGDSDGARGRAVHGHGGCGRLGIPTVEGRQPWCSPASALICAGAAFYLLMLGLVAEVALNAERESANEVPTAWEVR